MAVSVPRGVRTSMERLPQCENRGWAALSDFGHPEPPVYTFGAGYASLVFYELYRHDRTKEP